MLSEITYFEQINATLTVESICTKFDDGFPPEYLNCNSVDAWDEYVGFDANEPYPIRDSQNNIRGFVWSDDKDENATLYETREKIDPLDFLSSNTTVLDAIELFDDKSATHFYILDKNDIVGVLLFDDLYKPLGRLAFLALALEIEELALEICQISNLRERCWSAISLDRQKLARRLYTKRYSRKLDRTKLKNLPLKELIDCTYLTDKATMIWKCKLIEGPTRKKFLGIFHKLEEIRNDCAHPKSNSELKELLPKERLIDFVSSVKNLKKDLNEASSKLYLEDISNFFQKK